MLKEETFSLENLSGELIDVDITQSGSWVAVTGYYENIHLNIKMPWGNHIQFGDKCYELEQEFWFPKVPSFNENLALVFGGIKNARSRDEINTWIINSSGNIEKRFPAQNLAVEDILITENFIVFTGFDEGPGLDVYNLEGDFLFTYAEIFGKDAVYIDDCYSAAVVEKNQIIFCPYAEFPMVLFDMDKKSQQIWELPQAAKRFHAVTKRENKFYFHRIYRMELEGYDFGIYEWQIGDEEVKKIGEYESHFTRGLPEGKFLAKNNSGYAIININ